MKAEDIWQAALGELQLQMTRGTFNTWLKPTRVLSYKDDEFIIAVENAYMKDWLENRLHATIVRTLVGIIKEEVNVKFAVWPKESCNLDEPPPLLETTHLSKNPQTDSLPLDEGTCLNNRYTFDNFVIGASNRLAHAASLAVAEQPASAYNPLFLYGGVGLGKTHLLQAIGNFCLKDGLRVLYGSAEDFTNALINSIRTHTTESFREKYRTIDILLIDDIQFLAGKESTQEEFFHTFNSLHSADKQLVLTSDRPPKALVTLEERLRSRFEWGLIADIQPPDLETRIAILSFKANAQAVSIPDDVLYLIAQRAQSNIRELEGALNRVVAYSKLTQQRITLEMAENALASLFTRPREFSPDDIIKLVAEYFDLDLEELYGRGRSQRVALPRQIAMFLAREETQASFPQIGDCLNRDHTTVLHGYSKIKEQVEEDNDLRREMLTIRERLYDNGRH